MRAWVLLARVTICLWYLGLALVCLGWEVLCRRLGWSKPEEWT